MTLAMRYILVALLLPVASFGYDWNCNLFCYNNGECFHGKGRFGSSENVGDETPWEAKTHLNGMYCKCPRGYTGLQCEISVKVCGLSGNNDDRYCNNGSECHKDKDGDGMIYYHCECDEETVYDAPYVAKFCEHISTIFCNHNPNDYTYASSSFCVNGGKCLPPDEDGTTHSGCECSDGWEGKHCTEKSKGTMLEQSLETAWNAATVGNMTLIFVIFSIATFIGIGIIKYNRRKEKKALRREREREERLGEGFFPSTSVSRKSFALQESFPTRQAFRDSYSARTMGSAKSEPREII